MIFTHDGTIITGFANPPKAGETEGFIEESSLILGLFPEKYNLVDGLPEPKTEYELEQVALEAKREHDIQKTRQSCQDHIYLNYSAPIQQSMAIGVYPSEQYDTMVAFIANCVEYEDNTNEALVAAASVFELESIMASIIWPVPGV